MKRKYKLTLRREFFFTGVLGSLLISLVFVGVFSTNMYYMNKKAAEQNIQLTNSIIFTKVESVLENIAAMVQATASDPRVINYEHSSEADKADTLKMYQSIVDTNKYIKYCYSGYLDGQLAINDYVVPKDYSAITRPWYLSAIKKSPQLSIGLPYQDITTKEWLVSISKVIQDHDGNKIGVLAMDCSFDSIIQLMNESTIYETQNNFILDSKKIIIIHQTPSFVGKNIEELSPGSNKLLNKEEGYISYSLFNGSRKAYYHVSVISDWTIVSAIDSDEINTPIYSKVVLGMIGMIILSLGLGLIQVLFFEKKLALPLTRLSRRIISITEGTVQEDDDSTFSNQELERIARNIEKMTESSLNKKTNELKLIIESTSDGILVLNKRQEIIHYNQQFLEMWNLSKELNYSTVHDFPLPLMQSLLKEEKQPCFTFEETLESNKEMWLTIGLKNGSFYEVFSSPLRYDEQIIGRLWSYRDITEKMKAQEWLTHQASTDDLTNLWNRRYFIKQGEEQLVSANATKSNLALIQMDIDYFKQINDTFGHAAGDVALKFVAEILQKNYRKTDLIGRIGGEEFCILIQDMDVDLVINVAEKIRKLFQDSEFDYEGTSISFTVSQGIAFLSEDIRTMDELIKKADFACYKAKAAGRNQTCT